MMHALHVLPGLPVGGAEQVLMELLDRLPAHGCRATVVSLSDEGALGPALRARRVPVIALGLDRARTQPITVALGLSRLLRSVRPDIIHGWLYHGALATSLPLGWSRPPVIWGLHSTLSAPERLSRSTRAVVAACQRLAPRVPKRIICCSRSAYEAHLARGYPPERLLCLPNGIDLGRFSRRAQARSHLAAELGIDPTDPIIVNVARFDPQKAHELLVRAAARLLARVPRAHFVLCGGQVTQDNRRLTGALEARGIADRVHLLGTRDDLPNIYSAADVFTLCSWSEALPLTLLEAMACGAWCVATDVGDCARVLEGIGEVVLPGDERALAEAWQRAIDAPATERANRASLARRRVQRHFDAERMALNYLSVYRGAMR